MGSDLAVGSAPPAQQLRTMLDEVQFPFRPVGQSGNVTRRGVCDLSDYYSLRQAAEPFRTHTQFLSVPVVGTGLTIASGTAWAPLFNSGTDESLVNTPAVFTAGTQGSLAETNADTGGALVKLDNKFFATHVCFEYLRPFTASGTTRTYSTWIDSYRQRLYEAMTDGVSFRMVFGDQGCQYDLDTAREWPAIGGPFGSQDAQRNGAGVGIANIVPLRRLVVTGSRDSSDQLNVTVNFSRLASTIDADPIVPIPTGVEALIVPVKMTICGFPFPWASQAQTDQVIAQLTDDPSKIAQLKRALGI